MILTELKSHFSAGESVTKEIAAQMDAHFRHYSEIRTHFFQYLPKHLLQSELISLINVEIKERLFNKALCESIQDSLKSLRRALIRLEDLRNDQPGLSPFVNDLHRLSALGERVESLYQKHWEYYRYQNRLSEEEIVIFLLEIDRIAYDWDIYLSRYAAAKGLADNLTSRQSPEGCASIRINYQQPTPQHFSVGTLKSLVDFLETGYRFISPLCDIDPTLHPLTLLQVEVSEPVVLVLAVPVEALDPYQRFLQYLFLKDMLKKESLLKVVFEAASKDAGNDKSPPATVLTKFTKEMTSHLKNLPEDGRFTISNRTFPDDRVQVLREFTEHLEANNINYDKLLREGKASGQSVSKPKSAAPRAASLKASESTPSPGQPPVQPGNSNSQKQAQQPSETDPQNRHISMLTER